VFVLTLLAAAAPALAHEVRPAYLELTQTDAETFEVLWKVPARGDLRLGLYVRLPAACEVVGEARAMFVGSNYIERSTIRHAAALVGETIAIDGLASTMTDVLVRIERLDGATQVARLLPASPSLVVEASPSPWQVSGTYFVLGVEHILLGIDHLLFVFALLLLVKGWRRVVGTITAFTIAHSVTLALATLGVVHVPGPPVEAIIALSIVFVASEILRARRGRVGLAERWPWTVAFAFGLLHGLGFAGALSEVGLPQQAIPLALLFFNIGVEAGQLLFIAAVASAWAVVRRLPVRVPRAAEVIPPYAIGSVAMFWVIERVAGF
jgi:hydrogenase/urease accessory protein HupE